MKPSARDQSDFNRFVDELSPAALVRQWRDRDQSQTDVDEE